MRWGTLYAFCIIPSQSRYSLRKIEYIWRNGLVVRSVIWYSIIIYQIVRLVGGKYSKREIEGHYARPRLCLVIYVSWFWFIIRKRMKYKLGCYRWYEHQTEYILYAACFICAVASCCGRTIRNKHIAIK